MAIEFSCPHCSAVIRVPDNAGGGKGKCPRCARRITVPKVSTKPVPKPADAESDLFAPPDADEFAAAESNGPDAVVFASAESDDGSDAPINVFAPAPRALGELPMETSRQALRPGSIASKLKRKRRGGSWVIPVGFGLLLCGAVGWFFWQKYQTERLVGELTAETAPTLELPMTELSSSVFKQSPDEMKKLMEELESSPVRTPSSQMSVQISASKKAVTIGIHSGPQTTFYRVDTNSDPALMNYRKNHSQELDQLREADLEFAASSFADEYQRVLEKKAQPSALNDFRNTMALPALTRGLGHQVVAVYGQTPFPCVHEDRDGGLYFLLPPGAQGFEITGRKHKDGKVLFPGKYHVKVGGELKLPSLEKSDPVASKKKSKKVEPLEESKSEMKESMDEGEMKPKKTDK